MIQKGSVNSPVLLTPPFFINNLAKEKREASKNRNLFEKQGENVLKKNKSLLWHNQAMRFSLKILIFDKKLVKFTVIKIKKKDIWEIMMTKGNRN